MKHFRSPLLFVLFLIISCAPKPAQQTKFSAKEAVFQAVLDSIYAQHPTAVGIMAHIEAPDQNISWSGAAGVAIKGGKRPLHPEQPVLIASNTKTYVAATILRLVEQGKIDLNQTLEKSLTAPTKALLSGDGYRVETITIAHLLSHTSGIFDHVNAPPFFAKLESHPKHRWTRNEQITLAMTHGDPLGQPGDLFSYSDTNYLLLTEIIEQLMRKPFYIAIRELINYDKHGLHSTWFFTLEDEPTQIKPMAHQYSGELSFDTYEMDPSFDLYGGGGIAASTKDLALFSQRLFEGRIFDNPKTLDLIYTKIDIKESEDPNYYLGLSSSTIKGLQAYGHGGFWGTVVQYLPERNASIAVFILERDKRILRTHVLEGIVQKL